MIEKITPNQIPDVVEFTIPNFDKYNPRGDSKRPTWFRMENSYGASLGSAGLDWVSVSVWPHLVASRNNLSEGSSGSHSDLTEGSSELQRVSARFSIPLFCRLWKLKAPRIKRAIADLHMAGLIDISHALARYERTYERTNDTNERTNALDVKKENPPPQKPEAEEDVSTARQLFDLWNENCSPLPKVRKLTSGIREKIKTRLEEEPDLGYWRTAISHLATSKYCQDSKWADFHWLIKNDTNHTKAFANKYGGEDVGPAPGEIPCEKTNPIGYAKYLIALERGETYHGELR